MAKVEGTLGALLQGVSQQPARIRVDGQVTEQINYMSDVSAGLTSRPAGEQLFEFVGAPANSKLYNFQLDQVNYVLVYSTGSMRVWDLAGTEYTINTQDSDADDYITDTMQFHVFNEDGKDILYCNNSSVTVEADPTVTGKPFNTAFVSALGGLFSREYTVGLTVDGTAYDVSYTTPNGTGKNDADNTRSEKIIEELHDALDALSITGVTLDHADNVLVIRAANTIDLSITVNDGDSGETLKSMAETIEDTADLPKYAPHGTVVRVIGDTADADDYFLRFESETTTTDGQGFGDAGVWLEYYDQSEVNMYDLTTMPHKLELVDGEFEFNRGDWVGRQVGNEEVNPMPSFVGQRINDISGFENRLVVVAGPNIIFSRSKHPEDFFRKSALALIDSDPIDMKSTKDGSVTLNWIVPFDRDLILLSDPGDSQFVVTGGGLTPDNASITLSTSYEMYGQAKPVTTGRTIVFPFLSGLFSGLKEFFTNDSVATNGADTLTEVQDRYIVGEVDNLISSKNFNTVALTTDSADHKNIVWIYKYLWQGTERRQASWSYWDFSDEVVYMFFRNALIYVVIKDVLTDKLYLTSVNLNKTIDVEGWHVTVDRKKTDVVSGGMITREFADGLIVQSTGCTNAGRETVPTEVVASGNNFVYKLDPDICPDGSTVYSGRPITRVLEPTMPLRKDQNGRTISSARIVVSNFTVHLDESSDIKSTMNCLYRQPYEFYPRRFPLDDEPRDPTQSLIMDYKLQIPWGERSDLSTLRLTSTDVRPTTILEIEWQGQITGTKRRV